MLVILSGAKNPAFFAVAVVFAFILPTTETVISTEAQRSGESGSPPALLVG
jgi:hypothetical protein